MSEIDTLSPEALRNAVREHRNAIALLQRQLEGKAEKERTSLTACLDEVRRMLRDDQGPEGLEKASPEVQSYVRSLQSELLQLRQKAMDPNGSEDPQQLRVRILQLQEHVKAKDECIRTLQEQAKKKKKGCM